MRYRYTAIYTASTTRVVTQKSTVGDFEGEMVGSKQVSPRESRGFEARVRSTIDARQLLHLSYRILHRTVFFEES